MIQNRGCFNPVRNKSNSISSFLLFLVLLIFPFDSGLCGQVTLAWDPPNSVSNLAGYRIYYGTSSGNYQWTINVGKVTTYILSGLTVGTTYYAAATDYNASGLESGYSNQVVFTIPSCAYTISPPNASFPSSGGTGSVTITTTSNCNWSTSSDISWITVKSGSGLGSGSMVYTIAPNTGTTSRAAALTIAGKVFTVNENGSTTTTYVITATASGYGSIAPSGNVVLPQGSTKTFLIIPNGDHGISNVIVDGVSKGPISSYTFSNITTNHQISAYFR
jgi:hypothetical protein